MKKRVSKDLILFIILIPLFLSGAFYISSRLDNNLPQYTVENKGRFGYSAFFETLQKLNLKPSKTLTDVYRQDVNTVQFAAQNGGFDINSEQLKSWIKKGGTLVYLTPQNIHLIGYAKVMEVKGNIRVYNYGKGRIIASDIDYITNRTIAVKRDNAYDIYKEIASLGRKVYFNETHIYVEGVKVTLWDSIPIEFKFIIYQFLLVLSAYFYYKGKRFGKPVPFYEEVEREENEYLYSAASLYKQAKCWDLMFEVYYKNILKELNCSEEDFLECWERENLPSLNKAEKVYEFAGRTHMKRKPKEYMQIVSTLELLSKILKKRREINWKTLKKI